ncbi:M20/M25/M40 family metallo-hydrolase [Planococcus shenhongbingii]|uniref:M20/M25/M40 family metallo-hydrolase n=1 Tax=Planococcus shenhongbingii TaxID=3058398 RepID=A0ABT8NGR5_9BACL|nr:M20/M25/M40 family metallo-hydrolase [Planococcus sp. N017]MDN7247092.1 M20/M25/M40 family metallo-hydrolase [Planococcus sp. N017]
MRNWNRLFVRQGFLLEEINEGVFDCQNESRENIAFLMETLEELFVDYVLANGVLKILSTTVLESEWLKAVNFDFRGRTEILQSKTLVLKEFDTYMAGAIRQLNRLGLTTSYCCDSHKQRHPRIGFVNEVDMEKVKKIMKILGVSRWQIHNQNITLGFDRHQLLDLAEQLSHLSPEMMEESIEEIKKQLFFKELETCLLIDGESGYEDSIREHVLNRLDGLVDHVAVDRKGNILAQKVYGHGRGSVILLNAHLDTVFGFDEGRQILKDRNIWTSSKGILGADDRAGVAVLLELAKEIPNSKFNGTVKFIFTVEEEIGLVGAKNVAEYFLWDVDAAFVADRRGHGDIVTSCGNYLDFCDEAFGTFLEDVAKDAGLKGWKCTAGGSSDTRIWASQGIQSVNLSVGYQNEHTSDEVLDVEACYETFKLLSEILQKEKDLRSIIRRINSINTDVIISIK